MIVVPSGHGYGIMVMFEFISIPSLLINGIEFKKEYSFENSLLLIGLVSLIGKVVLIVSLFYRNISNKKLLIFVGLTLSVIAFIGVALGAWKYDNFLFAITFGSGIPYLMYFGRVIYLINQNKTAELKVE